MAEITNPAPLKDSPVSGIPNFTQKWQSWLSDIHRSVNNHNLINNPSIALNSDFNWSRTKGNTPTIADGEFVDKWNVKANGMTFAITPTYYTSTQNNSATGSERFVNLNISGLNANDFIIYQSIPRYLSLLQNKVITFSFYTFNNSVHKTSIYAYIGFDTDNNGTDDHQALSKIITLNANSKNIGNCSIQCPKITIDNQINVVNLGIKLKNIQNVVNLDIIYLKYEISDTNTDLYIDHALEKLRIDNT